ncbi:GD15094 [Drosophila simulans]|uniref:GD15094 n=1 Tax=Drosophila simulans TaxID=7240 RepID=B4NTD6_DROSI|nr:GD15094 [Drosophila simulans]
MASKFQRKPSPGGAMGMGGGASSVSSTPSNQPRKRVKRCCRNFVTFMCTQVGVGALIVIYAICGGIRLHAHRTPVRGKTAGHVMELRKTAPSSYGASRSSTTLSIVGAGRRPRTRSSGNTRRK